jgi:hypothetical protein
MANTYVVGNDISDSSVASGRVEVALNVRVWFYEEPGVYTRSILHKEWSTITLTSDMHQDYLMKVVDARYPIAHWGKNGKVILTSFDGSNFVREQRYPKPVVKTYFEPGFGIRREILEYEDDAQTAREVLRRVHFLAIKTGKYTEGRSWTLDITGDHSDW